MCVSQLHQFPVAIRVHNNCAGCIVSSISGRALELVEVARNNLDTRAR